MPKHELPTLKWEQNALEPFLSAETLEYHYGKHHRSYVDNLNRLVEGTPFSEKGLDDIVRESSGAIFNNAAQHFNHSLYWSSLRPGGETKPDGELATAIDQSFGSLDALREEFTQKALTLFGSGWCWLVADGDGKLAVQQTGNAGCPLTDGNTPLLVCDVWEHAYYIDYRNARPRYVEAFWSQIDWSHGLANLQAKS